MEKIYTVIIICSLYIILSQGFEFDFSPPSIWDDLQKDNTPCGDCSQSAANRLCAVHQPSVCPYEFNAASTKNYDGLVPAQAYSLAMSGNSSQLTVSWDIPDGNILHLKGYYLEVSDMTSGQRACLLIDLRDANFSYSHIIDVVPRPHISYSCFESGFVAENHEYEAYLRSLPIPAYKPSEGYPTKLFKIPAALNLSDWIPQNVIIDRANTEKIKVSFSSAEAGYKARYYRVTILDKNNNTIAKKELFHQDNIVSNLFDINCEKNPVSITIQASQNSDDCECFDWTRHKGLKCSPCFAFSVPTSPLCKKETFDEPTHLESKPQESKISTRDIALIVLGSCVAVFLLLFFYIVMYRRHKKTKVILVAADNNVYYETFLKVISKYLEHYLVCKTEILPRRRLDLQNLTTDASTVLSLLPNLYHQLDKDFVEDCKAFCRRHKLQLGFIRLKCSNTSIQLNEKIFDLPEAISNARKFVHGSVGCVPFGVFKNSEAKKELEDLVQKETEDNFIPPDNLSDNLSDITCQFTPSTPESITIFRGSV